MASNAPRYLLRGASRPALPSCRLLPRANPYRIMPSRLYNRPSQQIPPAPPPPAQSEYAQKAQERALMSKLSTLSPNQITALLSSQPEYAAPPPPPSPQPPFGQPNTQGSSSWRTLRRILKFSLWSAISLVVGYELGDFVIQVDRRLQVVSIYPSGDEDPDGPKSESVRFNGWERSYTAYLSALQIGHGAALALFGLPLLAVYSIQPSGLITCVQRGYFKPGYLEYDGKPCIIYPDEVTIIGQDDYHSEDKVVAWPAHMRLLDKVNADHAVAKRRQQHLVAGTYGSPRTLGLLYQVVQDPGTDALSVFVQFGNHMCGAAGAVHTGAISTVLDESMGRLAVRHLPNNTALTAKLIVTYNDLVTPVVDHLYRIELDVLTKDAAAKLENLIRLDNAYEMVPNSTVCRPTSGPVKGLVPSLQGKPAPAPVDLDKVQTERKVWIRARMYSAHDPVLICEAEGLFVVPKGVELEALGEHW